MKTTRSTKTICHDSCSFLEANIGNPNIVSNHLHRRAAIGQPRGTLEAELHRLQGAGMDVDMIICMVADRVSQLGNLFEPADIWLFEDPADAKEMDQRATLRGQLGCLERVVFRRTIQVAFLVIPFGYFPSWVVATHFQVKRDGNLSFLPHRRRSRLKASRANRGECGQTESLQHVSPVK